MRPGFALERCEQCKAFRGDFRIGQNVFNGGEFRFGKKLRGGMPIEQTFVKQFLRPNIWTKNPNRFVDPVGQNGDEKRLRRLDNVRKRDRLLGLLDFTQFLRDRPGRFDPVEKLIPQRFFHWEASDEKLATSKARNYNPFQQSHSERSEEFLIVSASTLSGKWMEMFPAFA